MRADVIGQFEGVSTAKSVVLGRSATRTDTRCAHYCWLLDFTLLLRCFVCRFLCRFDRALNLVRCMQRRFFLLLRKESGYPSQIIRVRVVLNPESLHHRAGRRDANEDDSAAALNPATDTWLRLVHKQHCGSTAAEMSPERMMTPRWPVMPLWPTVALAVKVPPAVTNAVGGATQPAGAPQTVCTHLTRSFWHENRASLASMHIPGRTRSTPR